MMKTIVAFETFTIIVNHKEFVLKKSDEETSYPIYCQDEMTTIVEHDGENTCIIHLTNLGKCKVFINGASFLKFNLRENRKTKSTHIKFQVKNLHYNPHSKKICIIERGELSLMVTPDNSTKNFECRIFSYPGDYMRDQKCVQFDARGDDYCIKKYGYSLKSVTLHDVPVEEGTEAPALTTC